MQKEGWKENWIEELRKLAGVTRLDCIGNQEIRRRLQQR